jgi:glucokinase
MRALVGDCGGTFCRFGIVENGELKPIGRFKNSDYPSLPALISSLQLNCDTLALAIAGPDNRERIEFTNCPFIADKKQLEVLGFSKVFLMNDFVPLSIALAAPENLTLTSINGSFQAGHRLIIGAGTGLGVGALIKAGDKYIPIATESGHSDYKTTLPIKGKVCAETLLSGQGFVRIYEAIGGKSGHTPETLVESLIHDSKAIEAAEIFWDIFAEITGNLALIFLPHGGVFITGGMGMRLKNHLNRERFMTIFIDKPPYQTLLSKMPILFIETPDPAFIGLLSMINTPDKFILQ